MRVRFVLGVLIASLSVLTACQEQAVKTDEAALSQLRDDELFKIFTDSFADAVPVTCKKGDVTDDGIDDLIMIYREGDNTRMRVLINGETFTDEVPAPIENQTIEFKDIDHKDEVEFIISGSKRGNYGYAIYRIIDNQAVDLFGDGMESCC